MARYLVGKIQKSHLLGLIQSVFREKGTGQLSVEYGNESNSIFFISGQFYLDPASRYILEVSQSTSGIEAAPTAVSSDRGRAASQQSMDIETRIAHDLSKGTVRSVRFIEGVSINRAQLVGPFQTDRLLAEIESHANLGADESRSAASDMEPTAGEDRDESAISVAQSVITSNAAKAQPEAIRPESKPRESIIPGPWPLEGDSATPAPSGSASVDEVAGSADLRSTESPAGSEAVDSNVASGNASRVWLDHFRLREAPFSLTPDPDHFFLGDRHVEALAGLKLGLIERRGLMVLVGEVGTGKTTIVYSLLSSLGSEFETAYVSNPSLTFDEILESALGDLGVPESGARRLDRLEALNDFLLHSASKDKSVAIVIDEAQGLSRRSYEQLRLLLNFETYKNKLLQIILVGQPELSYRLARPELRQIADRIATRCQLSALSRKDSIRYINHRLESAGRSSEIFTGPALRRVVRASKGIPRKINVICHNALIFAFAKGAVRVDLSSVSEAVRDGRI